MGINQHHDGVSGTAKQHVADDYNYRIYTGVQKSNQLYSHYLGNMVNQMAGVSTTQWLWCDRLNGTYMDCPIANYANIDQVVSIHNPTTVDWSYVKLKVQFGFYRAFGWNGTAFDELVGKVDVICASRFIKAGPLVDDCDFHIQFPIAAGSVGVIKIQYDSNVNIRRNPNGGASFIQGLNENLTYVGLDQVNGFVFNLTKSVSGKVHQIAFDLRSYFSDQGGDDFPEGDNCPSGAYIFKPAKEAQDSVRYADLTRSESFQGDIVSELHLYLSNANESQSALVRGRYYSTSVYSEWDVILYSLPNDGQGYEVNVNFASLEIDNNNTFYTDSNGLEMQKRVLNYRPTWNFSTFEAASGNYFPVNSAIAIVDETTQLQMTVLNDRSQGGSVLKKGRIELMQNRRLFHDDWRGVEEPLNETDQYDNGIIVPATYRLQFFDRKTEDSYQRRIQLNIDEPLQYFFTFNFTIKALTEEELLESPVSNFKAADALYLPAKISVFPQSKNSILLRLDHIGDKFDTDYRGLTIADTTV